MLVADINGKLHGTDDTPLEPVVCIMDNGHIESIYTAKNIEAGVIDIGAAMSKAELALNDAYVAKAEQAVKKGTHIKTYSNDGPDYRFALEFFKNDMIQEIEDNWDELTKAGFGAERGMSAKEAATFLGHSTKGMSQEEIDDEVSEIQLAYFTEGEASLDEIVDKYNYVQIL